MNRFRGIARTAIAHAAKATRALSKRWPLLVLGLSTGIYILVFSYLSIVKYYSFHATVLDLGLYNQIFWLILNGGPAAYSAHGFDQWYPFRFAKLSIFVLLPIFAIYPHPETLLVAQTVAIGITSFPLYFLSRFYIADRRFGLIIALTYLLYYPLHGANLFDFHPEALFPLFFSLALYYWHAHKKAHFSVFLILAALLGPASLLPSVLFLAYAIWRETRLDLKQPRLSEILRPLGQHRLETALLIVLTGALSLQYFVGSITPYVARSNPFAPSNVLVDIDLKLQFFVLLLAPLGLIALWDRLTVFLTIPFAANVLFTLNPAFSNPFVLQYPLVIVPILFFGTIRGTKVLCNTSEPLNARRLKSSMLIVVSLSLAFAVVYSPIGPLNAYVQGGFFAGNHNLGEITAITAHDLFVNRVINLIPPTASVLTENDVPHLSGRPGFYVVVPGAPPPPPLSSNQYDFIFADSTVQYLAEYLADYGSIRPYIEAAIADGTFGILAMGQGVILLKRGYNGPPAIFEPFTKTWEPNQIALFSGTRTATALVHSVSDGSAFAFWYGPYATLPPGNFLANFTLRVDNVTATNATILTLDVVSDGGQTVWATKVLTTGEFLSTGTWQNFSLEFTLPRYVSGMELRGMSVTAASTISLSGISVFQTSVG